MNPRAFLDKSIPGGYQTEREGDDKEAHDAWVKSNTWDLTRDDFIGLSYFHGCLDNGSDGTGAVNGSDDRLYDVVYEHPQKGALTRSMVSSWLCDCSSFTHGYKKALENSRKP